MQRECGSIHLRHIWSLTTGPWSTLDAGNTRYLRLTDHKAAPSLQKSKQLQEHEPDSNVVNQCTATKQWGGVAEKEMYTKQPSFGLAWLIPACHGSITPSLKTVQNGQQGKVHILAQTAKMHPSLFAASSPLPAEVASTRHSTHQHHKSTLWCLALSTKSCPVVVASLDNPDKLQEMSFLGSMSWHNWYLGMGMVRPFIETALPECLKQQ